MDVVLIGAKELGFGKNFGVLGGFCDGCSMDSDLPCFPTGCACGVPLRRVLDVWPKVKSDYRTIAWTLGGTQVTGEPVLLKAPTASTASDMFLGWGVGGLDKRHYFVRQLRDVKISIRVETFGASEMDSYATWCGRALALAHARSGSSVLLSGYLGKSDAFDKAITRFSLTYADQNEKDHAALDQAVLHGKVKAVFEEDR
jgi:uncharacterized protein DUF2252